MKNIIFTLLLVIISASTSYAQSELIWIPGDYTLYGRWIPGHYETPYRRPVVVVQARPLSKWELKQQELNYKTARMNRHQKMRYDYQERSRIKAAEAKEKRRLKKLSLDPEIEAAKFMYAHMKKAQNLRIYMSKDLKYKVEATVVFTDGLSIVTLKKKDGSQVTVPFDKIRPNDRRFLYNLGEYESIAKLASTPTRISFIFN